MNEPKFDFFAVMRQLSSGEMRVSDLPEVAAAHLAEVLKIDAEGLQARFDAGLEREKHAPQVGSAAPDFRLELLDAKGARTGERRALSDCLGRPVALIFGSYT